MKKHRSGYALAEIVMALLLLAVMIVSIMGAMTSSLYGTVLLSKREEAFNIAIGQLDNMEMSITDTMASSSTENNILSDDGLFSIERSWNVMRSGGKIARVDMDVSVFWPVTTREHHITLAREVAPSAPVNAHTIEQ